MKEQAIVSQYPEHSTVALGTTPAAAAQNQPAPGISLGIPSIPNLRVATHPYHRICWA